jgi:transposase-like protein
MNNHRKTWSLEEKLQIVQASNERSVASLSAEFGVSSQMIYNWKNQLESKPDSSEELTRLKQEIKALKRDIGNLKDVVADQTLAIKIKDDIIKKKS